MTYAAEQLYSEVAYVAYYLHWSEESILDLEHTTRQQYLTQISRINEQINQEQ